MAILMRGGLYDDFDPGKMRPREWAVVLGNDPGSSDGRTVYLCFGNGNVKRIATHEDMRDIILNSTEDIRKEFEGMFDEIFAEMERIRKEAEGYKNTALLSASDASKAADTATQKAGEASDYLDLSRSYAVGTGNLVRPGDSEDNSKYYAGQAARSAALAEQTAGLNLPSFRVDTDTMRLFGTFDKIFDFALVNGHLTVAVGGGL